MPGSQSEQLSPLNPGQPDLRAGVLVRNRVPVDAAPGASAALPASHSGPHDQVLGAQYHAPAVAIRWSAGTVSAADLLWRELLQVPVCVGGDHAE